MTFQLYLRILHILNKKRDANKVPLPIKSNIHKYLPYLLIHLYYQEKKRLWSMIFNPLSLFNHYHNNCSSFFNVKTKKKIFFIFISNKIIPMLTHTSHTLFVISHRSAQQIHIVSFIFLDMNESKNARIPAGNHRASQRWENAG